MIKEQKEVPNILHGGDYNPDQWLDCPEILAEDLRLMKKAHVNCVTLGVFSWAGLEPREGQYEFQWLKDIIRRLHENKIAVIMATPTGALPAWMTEKYPEVMQTDEYGVRRLPGDRHNFCPSSPVMRTKMRQMNRKLSEHFGALPGVIAWHISNEYGGNGREAACHCEYCQEAFRSWLKDRYKTLTALNRAWWTKFWSHTYTDWQQIHSPSPAGENVLHGLKLDWKRFVSSRMLDFCRDEIREVKKFSVLPVTTNMMGFYKPLNYFQWADALDIISWDCYPDWHSGADEIDTAVEAAAGHSLMRSLKKAPFLLMESTPSLINWRPRNTLKRPGMHALSSLQAVACGSQSVLYFQWRKSRGSCEKFHGAVIDHRNGEGSRVFCDVSALGSRLEKLSPYLPTSCVRPKVALVFDWENRWALEDAWAVENKLDYQQLFMTYYRPLWEMGIEADIVDMERELEEYSLVIAPVNYMYRGSYPDRVRRYVEQGGCYVTTYWSGEVDESDLCFTKKHPLEDVLGVCIEETDAPGPYWNNEVKYEGSCYGVTGLCAIVRALSADTLAVYEKDFYAGRPAFTVNHYGKGAAYFIASQNELDFLRAAYRQIVRQAGVSCGFQAELPEGVTVNGRHRDGAEQKAVIWFLQNYNRKPVQVPVYGTYRDLESGKMVNGLITMDMFSCLILEEGWDLQ